MSIGEISAVMITRDAAEALRECLESLRAFPEVIVYDNGSTDATIAIAGEFPNVTTHRGPFSGFGPTKQKAVSLARNDWVFSIDADEQVDEELAAALDKAELSEPRLAYVVRRDNYLMGKHVTHGGWGDDWLLRLFNRQAYRFNDAQVHEKVVGIDGLRTARLDGALRHAAVRELGDFLVKVKRYSEIDSKTTHKKRGPATAFANGFWRFFKSYFIKAGFLEGWRGLAIAVSDANGGFWRDLMAYADRRAKRGRDEDPALK
jgi:glycosyltransferase involved in cell wall biosynthesis